MSDGAERRRRVEEVVHAALERPVAERLAFLTDACVGDEDLRREAASLIDREARAEGFLAIPPGELAANAVTYSPRGISHSAPRQMIGKRVGAYEIRARLGAGGMGEVYRAHDHSLHRDVAIKVLPTAFLADPERLARFEREARLLATLNHPHIGAVYGLEGSGDLRAIVLELIEGETLEARLQHGPFPGTQALALAVQIADALDHAHQRGVTHRDLKPANIMLTKGGAKLLDFGLAKWSQGPRGYVGATAPTSPPRPQGVESLTSEGTILGTLHYMAPEQLEGKAADARADVFAFGAVLYEMLIGRKAFDGASAASVMAAVLKTDPPALDTIPQLAPPSLERVIRKCLAKDPGERWQTTRDLSDELKWIAAEAGKATSGVLRRAGGDASSAASFRTRQLPFGVVAIIVAAVSALAGWAGWRLAPSRNSSAASAITRFVVQPASAQPMSGFDISPDGTTLVFAGGPSGGKLFIRRLDEFTDSPIAGTEGGEFPFFSPDGQWVGYFADRRLLKVKVGATGVPIVICRTPSVGVLGSAWLADGSILFTMADQPLQRVSAEGGEPAPATTLSKTPPELDHHRPSLLPGGHALLYTQHVGYRRFNVVVESVPGAQRRVVIESGYDARYLSSGHLVFGKDRSIFAVPFDVARLEVTGAPVALVQEATADADDQDRSLSEFRVSGSGALVFLPRAAPEARTLTWVDRTGVATPLPLPPKPYESPRLSPDGRRVAFAVNDGARRDIWTYELASEKLTRLTREGDNRTPLWTRDGQRLVFSSLRGESQQLLWQPADGSEAPEPLVSGDMNLVPGAWSPDGQTLLYTDGTDRAGGRHVFKLPLSAPRRPEQLTRGPAVERLPSVSPDGRWVAFASTETQRTEVFVAPFPGSGARRQVSIDGGREAQWSQDGRELVYRSGRRMFVVPVDTSRGLSLGKPRVLFEGRYSVGGLPAVGLDYDLAPDGRFLMIKPDANEQAPPGLHVVVNWMTELIRRVPRGK